MASYSRLIALLASCLATIPLPASALSWQWSYLRPADAEGPAVHAFGTLITTENPDVSGFYTINSVMGERNSVVINELLPAGSVAPGNCYDINTCYASDNLLQASQSSAAQLTSNGFNVAFADGSYANYFFANYLTPPTYLEFYSVPPFAFIPPTGPQSPDSELKGVFVANQAPGPLPMAGLFIGLGWTRQLRRYRLSQTLNK
jgi:prepilin-type processing-associated H-X9-DG protein